VSARVAAFLDRDGVLNRRPAPHQYVQTVDELELLPNVTRAVVELHEAGFAPIVISNQRGVARGLLTEATPADIESAIRYAGVPIERFFYCTHDIGAGCDCRKPRPGLLLRAAAELGLSLRSSVMIGDSESDTEAGAAAGCHTIRITKPGVDTAADAVADNILAAARLAIGRWRPIAIGDAASRSGDLLDDR
jgi:D-glycero-D-manno-heptose 1,7-bisphosphate phosphatase